jgi:hypothetical protein
MVAGATGGTDDAASAVVNENDSRKKIENGNEIGRVGHVSCDLIEI